METEKGWHIFHILEDTPSQQRTLDDVRPQVEAMVRRMRESDAAQNYIQRMVSSEKVRLYDQYFPTPQTGARRGFTPGRRCRASGGRSGNWIMTARISISFGRPWGAWARSFAVLALCVAGWSPAHSEIPGDAKPQITESAEPSEVPIGDNVTVTVTTTFDPARVKLPATPAAPVFGAFTLENASFGPLETLSGRPDAGVSTRSKSRRSFRGRSISLR